MGKTSEREKQFSVILSLCGIKLLGLGEALVVISALDFGTHLFLMLSPSDLSFSSPLH